MIRLSITAKDDHILRFKSLDLIHDAAINFLTSAGVNAEELVGHKAMQWSAGPLFARSISKGEPEKKTDTIVLSTPDPRLAEKILNGKLNSFRATRYSTGEVLDLSEWSFNISMPPLIEGQEALAVVCGSPIVFRRKTALPGKGRWVVDVRHMDDLSLAINKRLSRIAGREVLLQVEPDHRYISSRKSHLVHTRLKSEQGPMSTILGLSFPMILRGATEDLELAWYAGFGEMTRMGFGILALRK